MSAPSRKDFSLRLICYVYYRFRRVDSVLQLHRLKLEGNAMCTDRRDFLRLSTGMAGAALLGNSIVKADKELPPLANLPEPIRQLQRMTEGIQPISLDERKARIEKARRLMRENRIDAIYIEPGSSMVYFTGMRWSTSERMFAMVIPARGSIAWVCPKFEEERACELIKIGDDVRTWEEDESPYTKVADIFR